MLSIDWSFFSRFNLDIILISNERLGDTHTACNNWKYMYYWYWYNVWIMYYQSQQYHHPFPATLTTKLFDPLLIAWLALIAGFLASEIHIFTVGFTLTPFGPNGAISIFVNTARTGSCEPNEQLIHYHRWKINFSSFQFLSLSKNTFWNLKELWFSDKQYLMRNVELENWILLL